MLKATALLFGSAMVMGLGIRAGSDLYAFAKRKIVFYRAGKLLSKQGITSLRDEDPISKTFRHLELAQ